jgi:hypothetical protein
VGLPEENRRLIAALSEATSAMKDTPAPGGGVRA